MVIFSLKTFWQRCLPSSWQSTSIFPAPSGRLPLSTSWPTLFPVLAASSQSQATKLRMTIPGVGAITAVSYIAAIKYPDDVATSHPVGACLGLTTRPYQSGKIDYDGHISRRGDGRLRGLLYEVATVHLTRTTVRTECSLKIWGLKLRERRGFKTYRGCCCAKTCGHYA